MKIIKSETKGVFVESDIVRVAKEMVNHYHGIEYYDEKGNELAIPRTGMMSFSRGCMNYHIQPATGTLIILGPDLTSKTKTIGKLKCSVISTKIIAAFDKLNKWGHRSDIYTTYGGGQFAISSVYDSKAVSRNPIDITWRPNSKMFSLRSHMTWNVLPVTNVARYIHHAASTVMTDRPIDYSKSVTTLVIDCNHETHLVASPYSISWPSLPPHIQLLSQPLHITKLLGIQAHVYYHFTGKLLPDTSFRALARTCNVPIVSAEDTHCSKCKTPLWDQYYRFGEIPICKFCIHYDLGLALPDGDPTVHKSKFTLKTIAGSITDMPIDVEKAVQFMINNQPQFADQSFMENRNLDLVSEHITSGNLYISSDVHRYKNKYSNIFQYHGFSLGKIPIPTIIYDLI